MKRSQATTADIQVLRGCLADLHPGPAHVANKPPSLEEIFTPPRHANALDPQRVLVVGNRGVGKSFWSAVLTHDETRQAVVGKYRRLPLAKIKAVLGFHEAAGKDQGRAPSPDMLRSLLNQGYEPEAIWRGVLLRAVEPQLDEVLPRSLKDVLDWWDANIERAEAAMRRADASYADSDQIFLLVFDALDRLGSDWDTIKRLTRGVLQLALDMRGYRALRAKIFMRTDQSNDRDLFQFADASKIHGDAVNLSWKPEELFGLMYKILTQESATREALARLAGTDGQSLADSLADNAELQETLFYQLAGQYMGAGAKRGRTYTWVVGHLADAFGDTSPRSFLTALHEAANSTPVPRDTVIDPNGIRNGVQNASQVRVVQLAEDYSWISDVLNALDGLLVPCQPQIFTDRWRERGTVAKIMQESSEKSGLLPLELSASTSDPEKSLLIALKNIGVIEFRSEDRINMPDIFRVAARIKRRGGVRPPQRG